MQGRSPLLAVFLLVLLAVGAIPGSPAAASVPEPFLVSDVNADFPTLDQITDSVVLDDLWIFVLHGRLWRSDGSPSGTFRLRSCPDPCLRTLDLVAHDDARAFFVENERNLWVTDGSLGGTRLLRAFDATEPFIWSRLPFVLHETGLLFFAGETSEAGIEPWVSDGTPGGTRLLADLSPGPAGSRPWFFAGATLGPHLYFRADQVGETGDELWRTDGTPEGTRLVADILPGPGSSRPFGVTVLRDVLIFHADDGEHGRELWRSDGTPEGTRQIADVVSEPFDVSWSFLERVGDQVVARVRTGARFALWRTDGTSDGTRLLISSDQSSGDSQPLPIVHHDDRHVVFLVFDETTGREPWATDGTVEGTRSLGDLCPGPCSSDVDSARRVGDQILFGADDGLLGREPWVTDGTPDGTRRVGDLCSGPCPADPLFRDVSGDTAFLFARDETRGWDAWTLTPSGASERLTDFDGLRPFPSLVEARIVDQRFFFAATGVDGQFLWTSDATRSGTRPVARLGDTESGSSLPRSFAFVGDALFFMASDAEGRGVWRSDGTAEGTRRVTVFDPVALLPPRELVPAATRAHYFLLDLAESHLWSVDEATGALVFLTGDARGFGPADGEPVLPAREDHVFFQKIDGLWISDGTPDGTERILELAPGPARAAVVGDRLFFAAHSGDPLETEEVLWVSDGSPEGTHPVPGAGSSEPLEPRELTAFRERLFFTAVDDGSSRRIWVSDGTAEGTHPLGPSFFASDASNLVAGDGLLYFFLTNVQGIETVWASDGTEAGTRQVANASRIAGPGSRAAAVGHRLFWIDRNLQIWRSDGSLAGTGPVRLVPGGIDETMELFAAGDHLILRPGSLHGAWISDGTRAGTVPLDPLFPGDEFITRGERTFFAAEERRIGEELWTIDRDDVRPPPPPPPTGTPAAPANLRAGGAQHAVLLTWEDRSDNEARFVVEARSARLSATFQVVATLPPDTTRTHVHGLEDGLPYHFRVRAENESAVSPWSREAVATPIGFSSDCSDEEASQRALCLQDRRFEVRVRWRHEATGTEGEGISVPLDFSDDSGAFYFFDPANLELVVKVLDGRTVNGFHWTFFGALTNVEYWVTVTDTQLVSTNVTYYNPPGEICGLGDVRVFPRPELLQLPLGESGTAGAPCTPGPETLCLSQDRYRVEVDWRDPRTGSEGRGFAIPGTADSGFFWFFDSANVELVVKVLDGRTVNGHFWVFFGALTDVEYTVTVTDTQTGQTEAYHNEPGNICGQGDVRAF